MTPSIDGLLRGTGRVRLGPGLMTIAAGGAVYGAVMGCFGRFAGDRPWQVVYAAVKVPLLLLVTTALAAPSFFVLNSLLGLRADFRAAARAVAGAQAAVAVVLAALAPYTAVWYLTSGDYDEALAFNAVQFGVASVAAQWVLRRRYARLVARDRRHRVAFRAWLGLYAFVGIQMGWVLRPFVGQPGRPVTFFREGAWGNAYVSVADILWRAATG